MKKQSTQKCRICHHPFSTQQIVNHEKLCATKTPEQRQRSIEQQRSYRKRHWHGDGLAVDPPSPMRGPRKVKGKARAWLSQHLPEHPVPLSVLVSQGMEAGFSNSSLYIAVRRLIGAGVFQRQGDLIAAGTSGTATVNGNGRRVRLTLSLDWETVRDLLVQIGPSISVDKVELT